MKVRALRGVCVGPARNLVAGEVADIDASSVQFLANIGAVELVADEPAASDPIPPAPAGKKEK